MTDENSSRLKDMIECMKSGDMNDKPCQSFAEKLQQYRKQSPIQEKATDPNLTFAQSVEKRNASDPGRVIK